MDTTKIQNERGSSDMSKSQRDKGAAAEREIANIFKDHGFNARRGQCFNHEPDVIVFELPWLHIEVKRHEKIQMPAWIKQSSEACKEGESPCVIFRQSRKDWWVAMPFTIVLELLKSKKSGTTLFDELPPIKNDDF